MREENPSRCKAKRANRMRPTSRPLEASRKGGPRQMTILDRIRLNACLGCLSESKSSVDMKKRGELLFAVLHMPIDYAMIVLAGFAAYRFRVHPLGEEFIGPVLFEKNLSLGSFMRLIVMVAPLWILIFAIAGLYRVRRRVHPLNEFLHVFISSSAAVMALIIAIFIRHEWFNSRFLLLAGWAFGIVFVTIGRYGMQRIYRFLLTHYDYGASRVLVIGKDKVIADITRAINAQPELGYRVVKRLSTLNLGRIQKAIANPQIDEVLLGSSDFPRESLWSLIDFCSEKGIDFKFVPDIFQTFSTNIAVDTISAVPIIEIKRTPLEGWGRIFKRLLDMAVSAFVLLLTLPLWLLVAILIKLDTPGPVFFRYKRVGQYGKPFTFIKFRSMIHKSHHLRYNKSFQQKYGNLRAGTPMIKFAQDPRITRVGKFIRRFSIDELPQLYLALKGDMSLVGPRPHEIPEVAHYEKHHRNVLMIKPGITGLAQTSGRSDLDFNEEVRLDTFYIENWSLWWDVKIILKTLLVLFKRRKTL